MAGAIRIATPEDAAEIATVHVRAAEAAYRGLEPDGWLDGRPLPARLAYWRGWLADPRAGTMLVAASPAAAIAGFCAVATPARDEDGDEDTAELYSLHVDPDHWGAGIGRGLLDAALAGVAGRGFTEITLWVFEANARARSLYERSGFVADGARHPPSEQPPELRLRRKLSVPFDPFDPRVPRTGVGG